MEKSRFTDCKSMRTNSLSDFRVPPSNYAVYIQRLQPGSMS